jgi:hypothetical protein
MVGHINKMITVQTSLDKNKDLISKVTKAERADGMSQVIEALLNKCNVLNPTPEPKKKKRK